MSLTSTVPALVPLLVHSSKPFVPSEAVKYSVPLTFANAPRGYSTVVKAGWISLTSTVPELVPSLFQSSKPVVPSEARKYNVPLMFVRYNGLLLAVPGLISLTSTVPELVPSVFHNSLPLAPPIVPSVPENTASR